MESLKTSLCCIPTLLETRGPLRGACALLWLAHPYRDNSPLAQTECHRRRRAWISSRSQTRVLQGKSPTSHGWNSRPPSPPAAPRFKDLGGHPRMILKVGFPPTCVVIQPQGCEALGCHFLKVQASWSHTLHSPERPYLGNITRGVPFHPEIWSLCDLFCSLGWLRNNGGFDLYLCLKLRKHNSSKSH